MSVSGNIKSLTDGESPKPSCVSMKSDDSMGKLIYFSSGDCDDTDVSNTTDGSKSFKGKHMDVVFQELEHKLISLMKKELKIFKSLLSPDYPSCSEREEEDDEDQIRVREMFLKITLNVLKKMKQTDLADKLQTKLAPVYMKKHKSRLKEQFQRMNEGMSAQGSSTLVNEIYTELYITEGGSEDINNEHEVRQIETASRRSETQETQIKCNDIFKVSPEQTKPIRRVLTKGVAGIGKTVSVQKFILDWAEETTNQDLHLIFPLPFRELNLIKETNISLMDLLHHFFTDTKELRSTDFEDYKVVFIFDGLDECRLPLDFSKNPSLFDVRDSASVDVLLTNLIKGNLLPSALIWITSRPAAANQIPPECVDLITDWSALEFVLLNSEEKLDEFNLRKYDQSNECLLRLLPVIKASRTAHLRYCNLTEESCSSLASVLRSNSSSLTELNLSHNKLKDSGVKLLSDGLKNTNCKLKTLDLSGCSIGSEGCVALTSALRSNPSHLRELDLNYNNPGDSGVKMLSDLLKDPHCQLQKLMLYNCSIGSEGCVALTSALRSNPSHLRELNLNYNNPGDSEVKLLSDLLKDPHCQLHKLISVWLLTFSPQEHRHHVAEVLQQLRDH
ncbi:putative NACHT [Triplophysa rosa]|uniref:NACHT n=1 Tax=Triplophysa rosa TaxID=992332 RepID=A0A9W7W9K0_TRIRA|nr:putative NACHT [Triplophysa rosa]